LRPPIFLYIFWFLSSDISGISSPVSNLLLLSTLIWILQ
jgi:hypothetical protein